jgi:hypothetical protein
MEVSGQLYDSAALPPGNEPPIPILGERERERERELGW